MSWKAEAKISEQWLPNALCFGTRQEADAYAADLAMRWTAVEKTRSVWCTDPINSQWVDGEGVVPVVPAVA